MKKNNFSFLGMLAITLTLGLVLTGCATGAAPAESETTFTAPAETLSSLLRIAPFEIQQWEFWSEYRDVKVYSFNPEIKDELIQALKDANFYIHEDWDYTRDWNLQNGVLRWCVFPDNNGELQFSAAGDTTVYSYGIKYYPTTDGIPKTITITGVPQGLSEARIIINNNDIQWEYNGYRTLINGQTVTLSMSWPGTGNINIYLWVSPSPRDSSIKTARYTYSADGVNATPFNIKDEVTTLEWQKFIWVEDWEYIPG